MAPSSAHEIGSSFSQEILRGGNGLLFTTQNIVTFGISLKNKVALEEINKVSGWKQLERANWLSSSSSNIRHSSTSKKETFFNYLISH